MKTWLYSLAASSILALPLAYPAMAATLTQGTANGDVTYSGAISSPTDLQGTVQGSRALSYSTDFDTFTVNPPAIGQGGTVTVDILSSRIYPGETWQLVNVTAGDTVVGTGSPSNAGVPVTLVAGDSYSLEFMSTGMPPPPGAQNGWSVELTPLPGALLLFAGGLGLLGITGMRKTKGRLPTSAAA
jgi:hypothetical protein